MKPVFKIYGVRVAALFLCGAIFVSAAESVRFGNHANRHTGL